MYFYLRKGRIEITWPSARAKSLYCQRSCQGPIYWKIPCPPGGRKKYQPMSFGGKIGKDKEENVKEKGRKGKEKGRKGKENEKRVSKRVK
jgi:hypothetical protein